MSADASPDPTWHLNALGLVDEWSELESFAVLDADFSLDRFAAVCAAFENASGRCLRLHYLAVCPIGTLAPDLSPKTPPAWASLQKELVDQWPLPLPGIHLLTLRKGRIELSLAFGESDKQVRLFDASCDAFFLHGHVYTPPSALARLARRGSSLALERGSPEMAHALMASGFEITGTLPEGALLGRFRVQKRAQSRAYNHPLHKRRAAIVIGAGLAGTAVASALAGRNWSVDLLERESTPATGASGNLAAVFSPLLSIDDGRAARLSRACFLRLLQELRSLDQVRLPALWRACGVLQLPKSPAEEAHFRDLALKLSYPERYVQFVEKEVAEKRFGRSLPSGGWFFEEGGWVNPPSLCAARLQRCAQINARYGQNIQRLRYDNGVWTALGPGGESIASAPVLVLANAWEAAQLLPQFPLPFKRVRGQVAHLPEASVPNLGPVLSKDGYLTPPVLGFHCLGATYDFGSEEPHLTTDSHSKNLERLVHMLPDAPPPTPRIPEGRVGFRSLTPDRMPVAGAIPVHTANPSNEWETGSEMPTGLYCLLGLGSRGLVWSSLLGDFVAALIEGSPSPLPLDLAAHLSPCRFASRNPSGQARENPQAAPKI